METNERFIVTPAADDHTPSSGQSVRLLLDTNQGPDSDETDVFDGLQVQDALYEEDFSIHGHLSDILHKFSSYEGGLQPKPCENDTESVTSSKETRVKRARLGTMLGVFLPSLQNIFGVIMFLRLSWLVGTAGIVEGFVIVVLCCTTTFLTSISMSAIATNGVVTGGGSYFMISRALGPEFGGAVGLLFYLANTVASSMYVIGAIEILLKYIAPQMSLFGDVNDPVSSANNFRVYGTALLILKSVLVLIGVRFVQRVAPLSLLCVIMSILAIYAGIFSSNPERSVKVCMLGDRLLSTASITQDGAQMCTSNESGPVYQHYCQQANETSCDPYFLENTVQWVDGIPGLQSGVIWENMWQKYSKVGNIPNSEVPADRQRGELMADVTTSFIILLAIYFPSVTGLLTGSNLSGDLADPQRSIPVGTIGAVALTSIVYISFVVFFGATIKGELLRDKFGESLGGGMVIGQLAWPTHWIIIIGSFQSTIGAGLQSLISAPRLLNAIARDNLIPCLGVFKKLRSNGEPVWATLLTIGICEVGVLVANLDYITPVITIFFLMCYAFVNLACALQTLLRSPGWRPRFRFYHWTLSLLGLALCVALMYISSWYYTLAAWAVAFGIYKYIQLYGPDDDWGDAMSTLSMTTARYTLLRIPKGPLHTKNWRPHLLILLKLDTERNPKYPNLLSVARHLKAASGVTMVGNAMEGDPLDPDTLDSVGSLKEHLSKVMATAGVQGFVEVVVSPDTVSGISSIVQTSGLGGLRHNTVMLGWPYEWQTDKAGGRHVFIEAMKCVRANKLCLLVLKGSDLYPEVKESLTGTIDVWWIYHDGGLLLLMPFLLKQHKAWMKCKLRIFCVARASDNNIQMKADLEKYLYQLRINAKVIVVEMESRAISAYTYERTLEMEERLGILSQIRRGSLQTTGTAGYNAEATFTYTSDSNNDSSTTRSRKLKQRNVRRMHTAVELNKTVLAQSRDAALVVINLPALPRHKHGEQCYMEYLAALTEGLALVLMVQGSGEEVVTIYS